MAGGTTYEPCPPYPHHNTGVTERMILTVAENTHAMMIDSQVAVQFWGEAVDTTVHLHQRSPNEGLKRNNDLDGYQAPYATPYDSCCMDLENVCMMPMAKKYRITLLSTIQPDADVMLAD
jgi:hypothetical protein